MNHVYVVEVREWVKMADDNDAGITLGAGWQQGCEWDGIYADLINARDHVDMRYQRGEVLSGQWFGIMKVEVLLGASPQHCAELIELRNKAGRMLKVPPCPTAPKGYGP